jgi:hypothetical protein
VDAGESAKGRQSLQRALKIEPNFRHASDARRLLETLGG